MYIKTARGRYQKVTNDQLKAMRYIPEHSLPIEEPGLGVVYVYPARGGKFGVIAYAGNARKSTFHYVYRNEADMDRRISAFFEALRTHKQRVIERRADSLKGHNFKVGDIVTNSWGYEQTSVDWYRVIKTTKNFVWLQPIIGHTEPSEGCAPMSGYSTPAVNTDDPDPSKWTFRDDPRGKVTKHAATGNHVTMRHGSGSKWDGKPEYESWYG